MTREHEVWQRFGDYYKGSDTPVVLELERRVLGADYGGNSYTDVGQALALAYLLDLGPGRKLLEVGAGAGWPGLYLARETGCEVWLTDVPLEGLQRARDRAADEMIANSHRVVADGTELPFRPLTFDAVSHSDVLC